MSTRQESTSQKFKRSVENRLDQTIWPGFQGLSMLVVGRFFIEALTKGSITTRAAAISFRLFLAFFPAIILLLSLIPYVPIPNFQKELMDSIHTFFPGDTFSLVEETLNDLINKKYNTLISIGFILVIYYASNSINAIFVGFNESYHFEDNTHPLLRRVISIILIFVLGILLTSAITLIVFSENIIEFIGDKDWLADKTIVLMLDIARWAITITLIYSVITTLYNAGMGVRRRRNWKFWNVGAVLAAFLFVVTSIGFAYFINNFSQFNKLYGSLGTLMVLLIWMNLNCIILLAGFDLNASIRKALKFQTSEENSVLINQSEEVERNNITSEDVQELAHEKTPSSSLEEIPTEIKNTFRKN
jgi:membrane protein